MILGKRDGPAHGIPVFCSRSLVQPFDQSSFNVRRIGVWILSFQGLALDFFAGCKQVECKFQGSGASEFNFRDNALNLGMPVDRKLNFEAPDPASPRRRQRSPIRDVASPVPCFILREWEYCAELRISVDVSWGKAVLQRRRETVPVGSVHSAPRWKGGCSRLSASSALRCLGGGRNDRGESYEELLSQTGRAVVRGRRFGCWKSDLTG